MIYYGYWLCQKQKIKYNLSEIDMKLYENNEHKYTYIPI